MQRCCVVFISPLGTNRYNCHFIDESTTRTSSECPNNCCQIKLYRNYNQTEELTDRQNLWKKNVCVEDNEAIDDFHFTFPASSCLKGVLSKNVKSNIDYQYNKGLVVLHQELSVLYGNNIYVSLYQEHFAVINNVVWLIIGLYIKCIKVFLMLQVSYLQKLLTLQVQHKIYQKLYKKLRVVYPLTKWITTSLRKYQSKCFYDFINANAN